MKVPYMTTLATGSIDISKILEFYSNQPDCGAYKITSFTDAGF